MMKTGKNKRLLASILAASMLLAMSPFALAEGAEDTTNQTGQESSQSTEVKNENVGGSGSESTDPIEWTVTRSKTATQLDTNTWTSNVTLSLPSAEEALASDVVFVLDKSMSAEWEGQALEMLAALKEQAASTKAKVKVGVVIFNKQANKTAPLTDLATGYDDIQAAIEQTISSGTNTHAGLLAGKQMLDEDTEVAANRKYLIFVSDGITYMYNAEPTVTAWSFFADDWKHWANPENWNSKYGSNNPPDDWSAWMTKIGAQVEAQSTEYEYPYEPSGETATKWTPEDETYKNYANSIDKALYLTYQVYQEAKTQGYNCYAVAKESSNAYLWGPAFMDYLAGGETVNFNKIQNDILYAVSAGSTVTDTIGEKFTFGGVDSFTLKVGTEEIKGVKDDLDDNTVNFGKKKDDGKYPYTVTYAPNTKTFVWTINENVSNFAPVQLTYTVKLTTPETDPGTYGVEDLKGEKDVPSDKALFTNESAVLNAINSAGATLNPLDFPKPSVSYTVKNSSGGGTDPIEWNVSRSKTATALDTSTWTSNVTLSLPSAEEKLASDVVFVLDKSTSTDLEDQALRMLNKLKEQAKSTEAKVKVGVVIFNKEAHVTPLTDLATDDNTIEKAIKQTISSGTNTHAGLLAGKQMLDEDAEVAANRKYLIFISDGITYMYNAEPTVTAWSFMADSWKHWAGPDNWKSKYDNNNPPADWSAWMNEIGKKVEAQGTKYEYPYGGEATNCTPEEDTYKDYANSIDKALYLTYQVYQEAQEAGYNCYAVANEVERNYLWGPAFMRYLANGETVNFDKIQNDILYAVSAGSKVEDQMGDAFDFVPGSLKLTVGGKELKSKADDNMTYFGDNAEDLSETNCRFKVLYAPDTDAFVWTINENVSNFAPVQLTYTVKLTKPETAPGTYGTEDLKGEKDVPADKALFTNKRAVLNAINSAGAQLNPLDFPKPSVSYTVKKSSSGGGGGGGSHKPTVTIPDDVPTGLNGDDHFAYIVGYPNGNVEPNGNITRAEVATIFFRLLTEEVRTANSTQSNSLSDVTRGQWFNHAVSTLSSMGIVKGHNDGTFAPNAPITRAEFAAIAARFDDKNTDTSSKFTDIASHWAKNEIGIAANKGWINGYPDGTFRPNQYITRAEAMTLVNRVLNRLPENSSDLLDSMIKWPDNSDASAWYYLAVQEATNSHYYKTKENKFEKWTELRETRDWTELEK